MPKPATPPAPRKFNPAILTLVLLGLYSCARVTYKTTPVVEGSGGMVVSAHPLASQIGEQILRAGGNATDAAIAVQFALAVVCPRAGNLGGGGFWVTAPANDNVFTLDYRERAPAAARRDMYLDSLGEVIDGKSTVGALAAGIPGTVDGMWSAFQQGSKLRDWSRLIAPAAELARAGFAVSATEAARLNAYAPEFRASAIGDRSAHPFLRRGGGETGVGAWRKGARLVQPQLARTLDSIAAGGPSYFYDGAFAVKLAEEVQGAGGIWTAQDLSDYLSVWRDPIVVEYADLTVYSMPPPSSGGVALGQMLTLLAPYDLPAVRAESEAAYYHLLIEAMRRAYEDRAEYLGDPDVVEVPVDSLLTSSYLAGKWATYSPDSASTSGVANRSLGKEVYETTHTSVIDAEGNAVAVTTTLNGNFGCKVWSEVGGFFLNNEMDDFSAKPGVPNMFGLVGGEANAIAPGKRMLSSMTPTIVKRDGRAVLALGSPGGSTIITAVLQVMLNDLILNEPLPEAIDAPRVHHQWLPDEVVYERDKFPEALLDSLRAYGHTLRPAESIGRVKAIEVRGGKLIGVGDPRNPDDSASGF